MSERFNIYCDESCHLEHDRERFMVLGAVWSPEPKAREISVRLREIKVAHGLSRWCEIKWGGVSPSKEGFYRDVVNYFFDDDDLHFRAIVIDKAQLTHKEHKQTHDEWYYKMSYQLLSVLLTPQHKYRIFLDIKDTRSADKVRTLRKILSNSILDFDRSIIETIQNQRSHEIEQMQLADLLSGAVGYAVRRGNTSKAKVALVDRVRKRSGYQLDRSTLLSEPKMNLLHWVGGA